MSKVLLFLACQLLAAGTTVPYTSARVFGNTGLNSPHPELTGSLKSSFNLTGLGVLWVCLYADEERVSLSIIYFCSRFTMEIKAERRLTSLAQAACLLKVAGVKCLYLAGKTK